MSYAFSSQKTADDVGILDPVLQKTAKVVLARPQLYGLALSLLFAFD
jgi:hypothetical protein